MPFAVLEDAEAIELKSDVSAEEAVLFELGAELGDVVVEGHGHVCPPVPQRRQ